MNLEPLPLEQEFRVANLKNNLKNIERKELEEFTGSLVEITAKLAHQTSQLLVYISELEDYLS